MAGAGLTTGVDASDTRRAAAVMKIFRRYSDESSLFLRRDTARD
jgi:hypothetical protein